MEASTGVLVLIGGAVMGLTRLGQRLLSRKSDEGVQRDRNEKASVKPRPPQNGSGSLRSDAR